VTTVIITRTGERYHASAVCPSFADSEARRGRPVRGRQVELRGVQLEPCSICWPETPNWDPWTQLAHRVERTGDSPYEVEFVQRVLRQVPGLRASDVQPQRKAISRSGRTYFIDFVIEPHGGRQVAVEIDGYRKTLEKSEDTIRRETESKRADLVATGWKVINFSDTQVMSRTAECIDQLRAELSDAVSPRPDLPVAAPHPGAGSGQLPPAVQMSTTRPRRTGLLTLLVVAVLIAGSLLVWKLTSAGTAGLSPLPDGVCPTEAPIKGNVSQSGERIFHEPGWRYYESTNAEECFKTPSDAESAGYRASEVH